MSVPAVDGPDVLVVGAARSGTSSLASTLGRSPFIDPGDVKEPNFFSGAYDRGPEWYDGLFEPRRDGVLRLDGSVSYTFPQHPDALRRIAASRPGALVIYVVREPVMRALSHYRLMKYYSTREVAPTFGAALSTNPVYLGTSDYRHWLEELRRHFGSERLMVVPFPAVQADLVSTANVVLDRLGLPHLGGEDLSEGHKNEVREFRHPLLRDGWARIRRTRAYPIVRQTLGADRLRKLQKLVTRASDLPSLAEELSSCRGEQSEELRRIADGAVGAVDAHLELQDAELALAWREVWQKHVTPEPDRAGTFGDG
jgi:hypothetical protein